MPIPRISVCIPTYNYGRYLPRAIDSILQQTFEDFELLITDDGSSDETVQILPKQASRDSRIRFRISPKNRGMVENWNLCLREARGEFIKYVFADDLLNSRDALARFVEAFETSSSVSLVASSRTFIDRWGSNLGAIALFRRAARLAGTRLINLCLEAQDNLVGEPTAVMFRRSDAVRGFNATYRQIVDLEMWFHLAEKGEFCFLPEPLCACRVHPQRQSIANRGRPLDVLNDIFQLNDQYLEKPYVTLGRFGSEFIRFDSVYRVWRACQSGAIERAAARRQIEARYGYRRFLLLYPVYKLCKPWRKLYRWTRHDFVRQRTRFSLASEPGPNS